MKFTLPKYRFLEGEIVVVRLSISPGILDLRVYSSINFPRNGKALSVACPFK